MVYTGYELEYLLSEKEYDGLLLEADILIDGRFDVNRRDLTQAFKGSTNQRIIDIRRTRLKGIICTI